MKRTVWDLLVLAATGCVAFLFFGLFIIIFDIPNRAGLDSSSLSNFTSLFFSFARRNEAIIIGSAFVLCVGIRAIMKLTVHLPHLRWHLSSEVHPVHSAVTLGKTSPEPSGTPVAANRLHQLPRRHLEQSHAPQRRAS